MPSIQTLDARYIDGQALLALLTRLFGQGNFRVDVCDTATRLLPEDRARLLTGTWVGSI